MAKLSQSGHSGQAKATKPDKPYPEYPLFPHASGRWAKKIRGRLHYFGQWAARKNGKLIPVPGHGWREALDTYQEQVDDLQAGRSPRPKDPEAGGTTMRELCNAFLEAKESKLESGELSPTTFMDYRASCDRLIKHFGKFRRLDDLRPEDFADFRKKLAKGRSLTTLKNHVNLARITMKFAYDHGLIERPIRYGQAFDKPARKNLQKERNEGGPKLFERDEIVAILDECDPIIKAIVLLGINCGFGNMDVASLPQSAIDHKNGWIEYPRPKTAIDRRIPLWPETLEALKEAIDLRPDPRNPADDKLCFLTLQGNPWVRHIPHQSQEGRYIRRDTLGNRFSAILRKLKINGRRGLGFYTLRHNFETIAGGSKDQVAVDAVMGHSDASMAANYRHGIEDERLQAVTEHVRKWLFGRSRP